MSTNFYFEIQVEDPERAQPFYEKLFDGTSEKATGMPLDYWNIHTGGMFGQVISGIRKEIPLVIPGG